MWIQRAATFSLGKAGMKRAWCGAVFSAWAWVRHLSASTLRREARRWRPCDSHVAHAPATTPSMAATITTANSGAAIERAALSVVENGSNDTVTKSRLAKAKPRRMTAQRARMTTLRSEPCKPHPLDPSSPRPFKPEQLISRILTIGGAIETLAHFFPGLEEWRQFFRHRNLVASSRIATGACLTLFGRECPEATKLDALPARERVRDLTKNSVDNVLNVALIEMRITGRHALDELRLYHQMSPPRNDPGVLPYFNALKWGSASIANHQRFVLKRSAHGVVSAIGNIQSERRTSYWPVRRNRVR